MSTLITSLHNPRVKEAVRLRDRKGRQQQVRIIIDGVREIARAVASGVELSDVFVCEELCRSASAIELKNQLANHPAGCLSVTSGVFAKLAYGERQEGIIATARTPHRTLADLQLPSSACIGVLEGVEKPGNVGAVLRSADGAGIAALIVADGGTDLYNPNAIRASLGAIFSVPVCATSSSEVLSWLRARKMPIVAARVDGASWFHEVDYRHGAAIVLGSEADGLTSAWSASDITAIKLPMLGTVDSLNVSVTAGVLFYEAWRQRHSRDAK